MTTGFSRRIFLQGAAATSAAMALPAFGQASVMPPARMVSTNGIELSVHEAGEGPPIVLLHGFPGIAFTWRHQIPALVAAGYRVIVPDLRGYGQSSMPERVEDYDIANLTGDVAGMMDAMGVEKAVVIGHDWGGLLAWQMALLHPNRVAGVASMNTPHIPHWMLWLHPDIVEPVLPAGQEFRPDPARDPIEQMREVYTPDMYVLMFQEKTAAEEGMNSAARAVLRGSLRKNLITPDQWGDLPPMAANMEYYGGPAPAKLPGDDVLTAAELDYYTKQYQRTGFTPAINWYRNLSRNWRAGRDVDQTVRVPSLMISAANDVVLRPSMTEGMEAHVPDLERHVVQDCWHWTPEEKPDEVNRLVTSWLTKRFA